MLHVDPLAHVALHEVVQLPAHVPLGHWIEQLSPLGLQLFWPLNVHIGPGHGPPLALGPPLLPHAATTLEKTAKARIDRIMCELYRSGCWIRQRN